MTEPVRRLTTPSGSQQASGRNLTLFRYFALGLGLLLAILASMRPGNLPATVATQTQGIAIQSLAPTSDSTQAPDERPPTLLPDIPPTPNEMTPSPLGVTAAELRDLTVTIWIPWTGSNEAVLQFILDEFNQSNRWGITAEVKGFEGFGRLDEAMDAALRTSSSVDVPGLAPDIAGSTPDVPGSTPDVLLDYGYQARYWDENNLFVDLRDYLDDPVWGFSANEKSDFYPDFWAEDVVHDEAGSPVKRLGIPYSRSAYVMFYNQSWGRDLGFSKPPTTIEELSAQACAAADELAQSGDKTSQGKGGWLVTPQPGTLVGWIRAFGGNITDPSGSVYRLNTPETRQAFETLKGLQKSGCAWLDANADIPSALAKRQALFAVGSLLDIATIENAFSQAGNQDEWQVIAFPSNNKAVVSTYGPSLFITRSSPAKQLAAWLVIEWLVYPPQQADWVSTLEVYPTRKSAMNYLTGAISTNFQWAESLQLIPDAQSEPSLGSWRIMRWAFSDALTQVFDPQLQAEQIPTLVENLDNVAAEIVSQAR